MSAIGYGANVDFSGALLYNDGEGEDGNLFGVAQTLMSDASSKMNEVRNISLDMKEGISDAVSGVRVILNDTSILSVGTTLLISTLNDTAYRWTGYYITANGTNGETYEFECEFCSTFGETIGNITTEINEQLGPVLDDLDNTVTEISSSLVDSEGEILNQTEFFIGTITEARDAVEDAEDLVTDIRDMVEMHNGHRELSYNIIFAIPLIAIVYLLFGGVLKQPMCFTCAYCYLWFSCTLMWLLLATHLPIAVLLNDSCNFLEVMDQNISGNIDGTEGEVLEACFNGEPLVETLGLSSFLNFTEIIEFPSFGNISENFQFGQLDAFEGDAFSTNFTTFYVAGDEALEMINNLTSASPNADGTVWTRDNIDDLNSSVYYQETEQSNGTNWGFMTTAEADEFDEDMGQKETLDYLQGQMMAEETSISAFNRTVYDIRADLTVVDDQVVWLQESVEELVNNVENASVLLTPVFDSVHDMEMAAECGFVGDAYQNTKAVMCSAVLGSLSRIVVAMFVIAVLSMFGCMWSIKLVRRVDHWQRQKREEKEEKLQQSMQPKKRSIILMQQPQGYQQPGYGYNGHAI